MESMDWDRECNRRVEEYPFYSTRLAPIDWQDAIAQRRDWTDPNFPHNETSLYDRELPRESRHNEWSQFIWKRPQDVYGEGNFCLYETPGPNDIKQGQLGNCYFLASLSAIAEYPERIEKIFLTKEVSLDFLLSLLRVLPSEL